MRIKRKVRSSRRHISKRYLLYIIGSGCIIIGILIGAIIAHNVNEIQRKELLQYIETFFSQFPSNDISSKQLLLDTLLKNIKQLLWIWVMGFLTIGIPFVCVALLLRGLSYGFMSTFLLIQYGWDGLLFGFTSFFPQNLIFIPAFVFVARYSIQWSISHYKKKQMRARWQREQKHQWIEYSLVLLLGLACIVLGSIIETYFTPVLMRFLLTR